VVGAEALDAEVEALVAAIVAKPRVAIAMGKGCSTASSSAASKPPTRTPGRTMACNMMDDSALEGVQAFIEKRPPNWPT
jgi:1,4-dihydroxy-2-naphthoyl-CoA synthase